MWDSVWWRWQLTLTTFLFYVVVSELPVRHFTTVAELGDLLLKDWIAVIDLYYPSISPLIFPSVYSEVFRQWSAHEAFAMARRQVFVRTPRIREMTEVLNLHAEVEQGIKRRSSMVVPTAVLGTFMTSLPGSEKESLPPILVLAGRYISSYWGEHRGGKQKNMHGTSCRTRTGVRWMGGGGVGRGRDSHSSWLWPHALPILASILVKNTKRTSCLFRNPSPLYLKVKILLK